MSWRQVIGSFLRSTPTLSMIGGGIATGTYVSYADGTRYPRMMSTYAHGNILPPMAENTYETVYFPRPQLEKTLKEVLSPTFSNEYFLVNGDFGTGKTRTIVELTRNMMATNGVRGLGAPIYVLADQGTNFSETLAAAVNFHFDEHISFRFFVDFILRIHSMPQRDEGHRLARVLDAIEVSAFAYMQKTGRPAVIVIDGVGYLSKSHPGTLQRIQEKAKLWADANIVKLVLVNNEEEHEAELQKNASSWARLATPIIVEDMSPEEGLAFLQAPHFMETDLARGQRVTMDLEHAQRIVDLVGGRIVHLMAFKRDWLHGVPFSDTAGDLQDREREKLFQVWRTPASWTVIEAIRDAPNQKILMSEIIKKSSFSEVYSLAKRNIIRYDRDPDMGLVVTFRSTLTKHVVDEMHSTYVGADATQKK